MDSNQSLIEKSLAAGKRILSEYDSKKILAKYGIPTCHEKLVTKRKDAEIAASQIGYPVVLKVCSAEISHKTEQGLIELGISNIFDLQKAFDRLAPKAEELDGHIMVQEMVKGSRELVVGMIRDNQLGPCVMFGLGGIFTETLADVSFRMAPIDHIDVMEMFSEIRGKRILEGIRGKKQVDLNILESCLKGLARIGMDYPCIHEIDVNPLIVRNGIPVAADALIVLEEPLSSENHKSKAKVGLEKFFEPSSVAVIGASSIQNKAGNDVIHNILANNFRGNLYLVNPKGGEIMGHKVYSSIQALPKNIDLAIIILPAGATPKTIRECAAKGIKAVVLAAGGFAEVDPEGEALQADTLQAIQETAVRAIGPNTSGHISTPHNFTSSFFPLGKIPRGRVSYIAQTGNFATHTMRYIKTGENFGVARVMGVGNKLDVEESEILEYYAQDPETKAVFIYLESFKYPKRFLKIAREITKSKPVVLLKGGATAEGANAAIAHTAALASDDRIIDCALRQAGVVRIYHYSHLFLAAKAVSAMPLPKGNRISFLAPSGAMLVCLTDLCHEQLQLKVPEFEDKTQRYLQNISPPFIRIRNPVDIWPAAAVKGVEFSYRKGTEAVLKDDNVDAAVMILLLTDETGVPPLQFIVDLAQRYSEKPLYVTFTGDKKHMDTAKAFLEPRGVPTFSLIEEPFEILSILARCRQAMNRGS